MEYSVDVGAYELGAFCDPEVILFRRGDCNFDGTMDIADPIGVLGYLFAGGRTPICMDACDTDDSQALDISDAIGALSFLFAGGLPPALLGPETPGVDPTRDCLAVCSRYKLY